MSSVLLLKDNSDNPQSGVQHTDHYIEDITQWQEDMNFMFEWQEQYLTSHRQPVSPPANSPPSKVTSPPNTRVK